MPHRHLRATCVAPPEASIHNPFLALLWCAFRSPSQLVKKHDFQFDSPLMDIATSGVAGSAASAYRTTDDSGGAGAGAGAGETSADSVKQKQQHFQMLYSSEGFTMLQDSLADHKAVRSHDTTVAWQ